MKKSNADIYRCEEVDLFGTDGSIVDNQLMVILFAGRGHLSLPGQTPFHN